MAGRYTSARDSVSLEIGMISFSNINKQYGKQLVFASNREPNQDEFFNCDLFTLQLSDNSIHRLTATEYCEYEPLWSPDGKLIIYRGTHRGLTDRETTMEDTHVWLMNADGSNRQEIGAVIDNRQGAPQWSPDGKSLYFAVQERGHYHLARLYQKEGRKALAQKEFRSFERSKSKE